MSKEFDDIWNDDWTDDSIGYAEDDLDLDLDLEDDLDLEYELDLLDDDNKSSLGKKVAVGAGITGAAVLGIATSNKYSAAFRKTFKLAQARLSKEGNAFLRARKNMMKQNKINPQSTAAKEARAQMDQIAKNTEFGKAYMKAGKAAGSKWNPLTK